MKKLLLGALLIAVLAIGIGVYTHGAERFILLAMHKVLTLRYEYAAPEARGGISPSAKAFQELLKAGQNPSIPTLNEVREALDKFSIFSASSATTTVEEVVLNKDGLKGYWVTPATTKGKDGPVVYYLHGGAYIAGSFKGYAGYLATLASRINGRAFFVEYRLGPEAPMPACVEDALVGYKYLVVDKKVDANRIAFAGDSAGGGLVLLTLLALQQPQHSHLPIPAAAVTLSAWTDVNSRPDGLPSYTTNKESESVLTAETLNFFALLATGTKPEEYEKRKSPLISPLYASLNGVKFPPLLMNVGGSEILLDDTLHFYGKAKQANLDVELMEVPGMQHAYPFFYEWIEEGNADLHKIAQFITKHTK